MIVVAAPTVPGDIAPVTLPSVYSEPPPCVPFSVAENLNGCVAFVLSPKLKVTVCPLAKLRLPVFTPSR